MLCTQMSAFAVDNIIGCAEGEDIDDVYSNVGLCPALQSQLTKRIDIPAMYMLPQRNALAS